MPLVPPPDHSKSYFAAAVGISISLIILALNRYVYPGLGVTVSTGFLLGVVYRDGTKAAIYNRPSLPRSSGTSLGKLEILFGVLILSLLIIFLSSRKARVCHVCGRVH
uniref:Movement protein TGB2 n=1 Tax=Cowpea mild mottle virus TaxID=67761 RepID=U5U2B3_9VIRU|nr:triple gene block 2 [Cowpea mild mottle virus]